MKFFDFFFLFNYFSTLFLSMENPRKRWRLFEWQDLMDTLNLENEGDFLNDAKCILTIEKSSIICPAWTTQLQSKSSVVICRSFWNHSSVNTNVELRIISLTVGNNIQVKMYRKRFQQWKSTCSGEWTKRYPCEKWRWCVSQAVNFIASLTLPENYLIFLFL